MFSCGDLPHTGQRLVWKLEDIQRAALTIESLDSGPGVLHAKRPPLPLKSVATDIEFVLEKPVKRGCKLYAQVWESHISFCGQRYPITVKLFMGRYSTAEKWTETSTRTDFKDMWYQDRAPPEYYMMAERDAYELLAGAQGSIVPWSYGFQQHQMPWEETCHVHILEHIDGVSPTEYCKTLSKDSPAAVDALVANFFQTYVEIHHRDVFHGISHRASQNTSITLLQPVDPADPKFVLYDFEEGGSAIEFDSWNKMWAPNELDRMYSFLELCEAVGWKPPADYEDWIYRFTQGSEEAEQSRRGIYGE